jgi:monofunctional biosynthetic peptidoglycan transglycosylase
MRAFYARAALASSLAGRLAVPRPLVVAARCLPRGAGLPLRRAAPARACPRAKNGNRKGDVRRLFLFVIRLVLGASAAVMLLVALFSVMPVPATAFMIRASIERGAAVDYDWAPDVSANLKLAVVAAEDQRFAEHSGFDFEAIEKAARHNERGGSMRGASTISQQVAKNLFLWPERSWVRKGLEAAITVLIESIWSKRRILDVYVNIVELGDGVFGAEAAARRFFGKSAATLTDSESAVLAAVLPNPRVLRAGAPSSYVRRRQQWILRQMNALGGTAWLRRLD